MKKFNNNYRTTVKNTLLEMMYMSGTLCEAPDDGVEGDLQMPDGTTRRVTIPNSQGSSFNNEIEKLKNADTEEAKKQKEEIQKKEDNPNYNYVNKNERIKQVGDMAKIMTDSSPFKLNASASTSAPTSTSKNGRREHDLLTQDEAENGNPRENRIKTQRRYEALPPEEKKARGERANNARQVEWDWDRSLMTQKERDAQDAKPTGAWRVDPATGEKLKDTDGKVMDPTKYAAIDKANGIKTPSEFGDGRTLGQRLAGVGKHQRVYEPMTKADQQKRYDNSSKDINNPGYDNSEYGKRQRQKEWEVIDNTSIEVKNSHTAALAAQERLNKIQADAKARLPASTARRVAGERKLASMEADPNLKGSLAQRAAIQAANIANRARGY